MKNIIFNIPNSIGYFRLFLLFLCTLFYSENPWISFYLYVFSVSLDFIDGFIARKLNQCTKFGEWLDQMTDSFTTTLQYCLLCNNTLSSYSLIWCSLISIDWIYRINMNIDINKHWKSDRSKTNSILVDKYFTNNFNNPLGLYGCISNQLFPAMLYLVWNIQTKYTIIIFMIISVGFALRFYCEPYYHIKRTILTILKYDMNKRNNIKMFVYHQGTLNPKS